MTCQQRKIINYIITKMALRSHQEGQNWKKQLINFSGIVSRLPLLFEYDI